MKFIISKLHLTVALNNVSRAVSSRNPNPVLTGLKFELNKNGLFITGSDSDLSIVTKIPLEENEEKIIDAFSFGTAVLSSKLITEIIRKLDSQNERLEFELIDNTTVKIKNDNSEYSLTCMNAEDYPSIDLTNGANVFNISTEELKLVIQQTSFAASDRENRPVLTGVNFKAAGNKLECVATDSYRLARKIIELPTQQDFNITIPARTLNEIIRIIENEKNVEISVSDKKVIFKLKNTLIVSRLISGAYPETSKLIPDTFEYELETISQNFISAIDRAQVFSVDRFNIVKLTMDPGQVQIISKSQQIGSAVENITSFRYSGEKLEISFTAKYVIEAIRAVGTENISILFNGDMKPFIIKNKDDNSITQLVLPVRTY